MTGPNVPPPPQLTPYPHEADAEIRKAADLIGYETPISILNAVRVELLGDAVKAHRLATEFAQSTTLQGAAEDIEGAVRALAGTWQGRGAAQFNTYAGQVASKLTANQRTAASVATVLADAAATVIATYASLIGAIGRCAATVGGLTAKILATAGMSVTSLLAVIAATDIVGTIVSALETLAREFFTVMEDAAKRLGEVLAQSVSLHRIGNEFVDLPAIGGGSGVDDHRQWKLDPSASPGL